MQKHFSRKVLPAKKGPNSVEEGVKFLQGYTILAHVSCEHTIHELEAYSLKTDTKTGEILNDIEDANNHCIDALRYAVEGDRRAPKPPPIVRPIPIATRWR